MSKSGSFFLRKFFASALNNNNLPDIPITADCCFITSEINPEG
jgi:hypothetical protein